MELRFKLSLVALAVIAYFFLPSFMALNEKKDSKKGITISVSKNVLTLHPHRVSTKTEINIVSHLYEGLTREDFQGNIVPAIAEDIQISEDKKTYIFKLKKTHWSDGSSLTAYDFVRSWYEILEYEMSQLSAYLDCIKGAANYRLKKGEKENVGITATDDYSIEVQLEHPTPHFLFLMSTPILFPVNEKSDNKSSPTNGPFVVEEWDTFSKIIMRKNPFYFEAEQVSIPKIEFLLSQEQSLAFSLLQQGEIDFCEIPDSVPVFERSMEISKGCHFCALSQTGKVRMLAINHNIGPLKNKNVRKALSLAIDRDKITQYVTNRGHSALYVTPPSLSPGVRREVLTDCASVTEAVELLTLGLKELGMTKKDMDRLIIDFAPSQIPTEVMQAVQHQWRFNLGISVSLIPDDSKSQLENFLNGNFAISVQSWYADYPDPMAFLEIFESDGIFGLPWKSEKFDKLVEKARRCPDKTKRDSFLFEAEKILLNDYIAIPLYYPGSVFGVNSNLKGFYVSSLHKLDFSRAHWTHYRG